MVTSIREAHEELLDGSPAIDDANFDLMMKSQNAESKATSNEAVESLRRLLEVQAEVNLLAGLLIEGSLVTESVRLQPLRETIDAARGKIETNLKALANPELRKNLIGLYDRLAAMAGQDGIIAVRARELRRQQEAQLAFAATQAEAIKAQAWGRQPCCAARQRRGGRFRARRRPNPLRSNPSYCTLDHGPDRRRPHCLAVRRAQHRVASRAFERCNAGHCGRSTGKCRSCDGG